MLIAACASSVETAHKKAAAMHSQQPDWEFSCRRTAQICAATHLIGRKVRKQLRRRAFNPSAVLASRLNVIASLPAGD